MVIDIKYKKLFALILSLCFVILTGCSFSGLSKVLSTNTDGLKVHFLDVGQGDSIFIELPTHETILIDAGEREYSTEIIKYIKNLGYEKINYIIGTHPHSDHIGGLSDVINTFDTDKIYMTNGVSTSVTYEKLLNTIQTKGRKMSRAKAGVSIVDTDSLKVEFVAPVNDNYDDLNNYSAVVKLKYKNNTFLFMGDAETLSENEITADVNADVLKVGHHGSTSSTSEKFLKKVSPKFAVISVGKGNDYGHPHNATLEKLKKQSVQVFRTDLLGTIIFTSDGENIKTNQSQKVATEKTTSLKSYISNNKYILNTKTKKIHSYDCTSVTKIEKENIQGTDDYKKAIKDGYDPCKICNPK